jgi:hypothetical protein
MAPVTAADTSLTAVTATDLSDPAGPFSSHAQITAGTRSGGFLPASTCVLYNMQIKRRYRGGKPRIYVPAGTQPDLSNAQTWATAFLNQVNGALANLIGAGFTSISTWSTTSELVNVSYYHQVLVGPPPTPPVYVEQVRETPQIDPIVSRAAVSTVGTQRRRLRPG